MPSTHTPSTPTHATPSRQARRSRLRVSRRAAALTALAAGGVLLAAGPASAHVTVNPNTAVQGSYSEVQFRAPNEQDNANTTELQVFLPTDHPIASVSTEPVPGWTVTVKKVKLAKPITTDDGQVTEAVSEIDWTGGAIKPGQFQDFPVSLGPLPTGVTSLTFKALQTYSNGQVVRWIQLTQPGQPEPANPAPVLTLTPASGSGSASPAPSASASAPASGTNEQASSGKSSSGSDSDTTARWLGIVGIVVGAIGLAVGALGFRRRRSS